MNKFNKKIVTTLVIASFVFGFAGLNSVQAVDPPDRTFGITNTFSVYGDAGITNTGAGTRVWGNVGGNNVSIAGFTSTQVPSGIIDNSTATGTAIRNDASSVYDSLMSATQGTSTGLSLAGTHTGPSAITPGVYDIGATGMNGAVELSGAGVYIFRSDSSPTIANDAAARMTLTHGACASNVFWAIPTSMTIGTGAHVEGTIIAQTGLISLGTGAELVGRAISLTAAVTLDDNQITEPTCTPSLTVVKEVVGGGPKVATDFPLFVDAVSVTTGVATTTLSAGAHVVTETTDSNYTQTFSGSCPGGNITLSSGESYTCTITNTYVAPVVTASRSSGGGGGTHYGCKDLNALNYEYFAASNPALCLYTATSTATTTVIIPKLPNTGIGDDTDLTKKEAVATFYRSLGIGSRGEDVSTLQTALLQKGFLVIPSGVAKGYFGTLTQTAIYKYQTRSSLPSVGIFGPLTKAKLISELSE